VGQVPYAAYQSRPPQPLSLLRAVTATSLLPVAYTGGVQGAPDHLVAHSRQVLDTSSAHQDDRVLLEVVPNPGDVRRHFETARKPHASNLAQGGVRFFGRVGVHACADTAPLRRSLESGRLGFLRALLAALTDQLGNRGHWSFATSFLKQGRGLSRQDPRRTGRHDSTRLQGSGTASYCHNRQPALAAMREPRPQPVQAALPVQAAPPTTVLAATVGVPWAPASPKPAAVPFALTTQYPAPSCVRTSPVTGEGDKSRPELKPTASP